MNPVRGKSALRQRGRRIAPVMMAASVAALFLMSLSVDLNGCVFGLDKRLSLSVAGAILSAGIVSAAYVFISIPRLRIIAVLVALVHFAVFAAAAAELVRFW